MHSNATDTANAVYRFPARRHSDRAAVNTRILTRLGGLAIGASFALSALAQTPVAGLAHDALTRGPVPIPPSERALQTVVATPWLKVSNEHQILEGPIFDHDGNLLFCDVSNNRVLRATPDKQLSTVVDLDGFAPGGLALHPDGRKGRGKNTT